MLESFVGAAFLAAVFFLGWQLTATLTVGRRRVASAFAGVAVAYVFIYMLPELSEAGATFVTATKDQALPLPQYRVYVAALTGFVVLYGMEHLRAWSRRTESTAGEDATGRTFRLHIAGFAVYTLLVSATMAESASRGELPVFLFSVAMGLHFVGVASDLAREHGLRYLMPGRQILAGAVMVGWVIGTFVPFSEANVTTLLGLVSGGVVVTSMITELPREKDGRFWAFAAGAAVYGLVLLLLARVRLDGTEAQTFQFGGVIIDRLAARLTGPMNFRFILQPVVAIGLGIRDGRLDAKARTPPFVVDVLFGFENRREYIVSALKNLTKPVLLGVVMDAIVQHQIFGHVRPLDALIVGAGVIGLPYALARGLANRAAR